MSHLYRSEVVWSPVGHTNGNPEVAFVVTDDNEVFSMFMVRDDGGGNTAINLYFAASLDGVGSLISGTSTLTGVGTTAYDSGGTFAFEKEEAVDEIRWITPLGTETRALSTFGALDDNPLRPASIATGITRNPTNVNSNVAVDWSDFYGKRDGNNYLGAAMSEIDPGVWQDPQGTVSSGGAGGPINLANSQGVSSYRSGLSYVHATDAPRHTHTREFRIWAGGDNISADPWDVLIDAVTCPFSGNVYWVRVPKDVQDTVLFGYTDDGGVTLNESIVANNGGSVFQYPTLDVDPLGRIVILWGDRNDTTSLWWAVSDRYGRSFDTPGIGNWPGSVADADSPRYRYHPGSGHGMLVFRDKRYPGFKGSLVTGFDTVAGPTVFSTDEVRLAPNPHYGAMAVDPVGVARHKANEGTDIAVGWSLNWGRVWEENNSEREFSTPALQIVLQTEVQIGLTYWAWQEENGDVKAIPSDVTVRNPPDTTLYGLPPWTTATVVAALPLQQYVGLTVGPAGIVYVLYQTEATGVYSVHCKISKDHGASWSTP